jgi:surface antigen
MLSAGSSLYRTCRSITAMASRSGKSVAHAGAVTASGLWHGTVLVTHGIGRSLIFTLRLAGKVGQAGAVMDSDIWHDAAFVANGVGGSLIFTLHLPSQVVGSFASAQAVSTVIRPADNKSVPVISAETSAAVLSQFNALQRQKIAQWQAAQLAANQSLGGTVVAGDADSNNYPAAWADAPQDSLLDSWGMYNRECVSYAAWEVYQTYGYMPYWGGVGNANQWPGDANSAGIPTGSTPQVDSVAISMSGYYGHAMWVEKVSGDMIYVSQYNYDLNGQYSEMWVNGSHFIYIYFK